MIERLEADGIAGGRTRIDHQPEESSHLPDARRPLRIGPQLRQQQPSLLERQLGETPAVAFGAGQFLDHQHQQHAQGLGNHIQQALGLGRDRTVVVLDRRARGGGAEIAKLELGQGGEGGLDVHGWRLSVD